MHDSHDLELVLKSHIPIVVIETREEQRAVNLIKSLQFRLSLPIYQWTVTEGLQRIDLDYEPQRHNTKPTEVLGNIKAGAQHGIYLLLDFHPYLDDPLHVRLLKDIALSYELTHQTIVLISHDIEIPRYGDAGSSRCTIPQRHRERCRRAMGQAIASKGQGPSCLIQHVSQESLGPDSFGGHASGTHGHL